MNALYPLLTLVAALYLAWRGLPWLPLPDLLDPLWRAQVLGGLLALMALGLAARTWFVQRHERRLLQSLLRPNDQARVAAEVAELQQKLQKALTQFEKTRRLDERPWYAIIGSPGAGKTTALINSGLNFPLSQYFGRQQVSGVGGTRNCEWWFTEEAILLDTAGRYTEARHETDKQAWFAFLDLLRQARQPRPLNGVLVAVSVSDLLQFSAQEQANHAQQLRERIDELSQRLGCRLPIYVLFTKVDLLAGFLEYFNDLSREGRGQVWGVTCQTADTADEFLQEATALAERLYQALPERLNDERDSKRRDLIYTFPQQFTQLIPHCHHFLTALQPPLVAIRQTGAPTPTAAPLWLRGVYFTSGTQEGTPIDQLLTGLAATFGLRRQVLTGLSGQGKSFFITRLLRDVVVGEAGLGHTASRAHRGAVVGLGLIALVALGVLGYPALAPVPDALARWSVTPLTTADLRGLLDELAAAMTPEVPPWLDRSEDRGIALLAAWRYRQLLQETVLPALYREGDAQGSGQPAWLTLRRQLEQPLTAAAATQWLADYGALAGQDPTRVLLATSAAPHVMALLQAMPPHQPPPLP